MRIWHDIRTAPFDREVDVRVGRRIFRAVLRRSASMNEDEQPCAQWQATTDHYPRCWSDGCCWESNADCVMSAQPEAWREIAA